MKLLLATPIPPLATAVVVAQELNSNIPLRKLMAYYHKACIGLYRPKKASDPSWYINLYKFKECLLKIYGQETKSVNRALHNKDDLSFLGGFLNCNENDLRHAEFSDAIPIISREDKNRLFQISLKEIRAYLSKLGLPVIEL